MTDYSIAAIPTKYNGRTYRSRLEARWAAFFDHLGWDAEYEPFDLGAWSPDFLLRELDALVEVKPLAKFDGATWDKMNAACEEHAAFKETANSPRGLFLTRLSPQKNKRAIEIGWFLPIGDAHDPTPWRAFIGWIPTLDRPGWYADIIGMDPALIPPEWVGLTDRDVLEAKSWVPQTYEDYTIELWAHATAAVQYQPDKA